MTIETETTPSILGSIAERACGFIIGSDNVGVSSVVAPTTISGPEPLVEVRLMAMQSMVEGEQCGYLKSKAMSIPVPCAVVVKMASHRPEIMLTSHAVCGAR